MFVHNLLEFEGLNLFECGYEQHLTLLHNGFSPMCIDGNTYYYLLDEELGNFLREGVSG